ncbi:Acetyltransferase (GNAT) family protein [Halomicrobium zhouii]|uniref:Acetyltransferase (GNAT) family protein n=1 Tax=Halomicrobium zhouii TaxID=767519 RepID=A0A1I6KQL0_9EURY|nr:GNAT family N-acetyltransferase [Halomicrobium zhouii]SFR93200.1 Acetyltransferase (GNAT) family protein [Halomicrobium zhouii]
MNGTVVRQATHDDYEAVEAFTQDTWADQGRGDYIPDVFHDWVDANGPEWRTVVVEVDGDVAGICQGKFLSEHEAWLEGMRVHPEYRGEGHGLRMVRDLFEWARDGGATVARNMVFGWNDAGLGQSMAAGFEPRTSFRWAEPEPEPQSAGQDPQVVDDPAAAWSYWARSDARDVLGGLSLDSEHSWTLSELSRERLHALADDERVFAVKDDGTRGMAARVRTTERSTEDDATETLAEYAVGAWADVTAARRLLDAIRADAHELGADATRVLIPESPRHVAEAAAARVGFSEHCDFVLEADLT